MHVPRVHAAMGYQWLRSPFLLIILCIVYAITIVMTLGLTYWVLVFVMLAGSPRPYVYRVPNQKEIDEGKYIYHYDPIYAILHAVDPKNYFCAFFANRHFIIVKNKDLHTEISDVKTIVRGNLPNVTYREKSYKKFESPKPFSFEKIIQLDTKAVVKLYEEYMVSFIGTGVVEEFVQDDWSSTTKLDDRSFIDSLAGKNVIVVEKDGHFVVIRHFDEKIESHEGVVEKNSHDLAVFIIKKKYEDRTDKCSSDVIIH